MICTLNGCSEKKDSVVIENAKRIEQLRTSKEKEDFLLGIFKDDQDVRKSEYGVSKDMRSVDLENLSKIEAYLKIHGHPSKTEMTAPALMTPCIVIHHASTYEPRVRNFPYLYNAYKTGDLNEGSFSMFLARMYEMKFEERLVMGGPYLEKDKIALLLEKLELN